MPVIKSAIKKLRQDKKREKDNDAFRDTLAQIVKKAKKDQSKESISKAFSILDKAVKKNILHKNKAARTKSSLVKTTSTTSTASTASVVKKIAPKAKTTKKKTPSKTVKKK